jgi:predicted nucleic acid-binding protein
LEKSHLSASELRKVFDDFLVHITALPESVFRDQIRRAEQIMHDIDLDDAPFVALALSFHNDGIWSNDKDFDRQSVVRVWKTHELYDLLQKRKIR